MPNGTYGGVRGELKFTYSIFLYKANVSLAVFVFIYSNDSHSG